MSEILNNAINKVQNAQYAFCRFITATDTGKNGSHQSGFYIPKCAAELLLAPYMSASLSISISVLPPSLILE